MLTSSVRTRFVTLDTQGPLRCLYSRLQQLHLLLPCAVFSFVIGVHEDFTISPLIFQKKKNADILNWPQKKKKKIHLTL